MGLITTISKIFSKKQETEKTTNTDYLIQQGEHIMTKKTFTEIFGTDYNEENCRRSYYAKLTFTDKESYLKWVGEWKAELQELNEQIRLCKKNRKQFVWSSKPSRTEKRTIVGDNPTYDSSAAIKRQYLRGDATALYMLRFFSKEKAAAQREANLNKAA